MRGYAPRVWPLATPVRWLAGLLACGVLLVLIWPFRTAPRPGVDLSWRLGLHQAATDGLHFGTDIVFTYGPLGFLGRPMPFVGPTSALAFVAMVGLYLLAIVVILRAARRLMPLVPALIVTLVLGRTLIAVQPFEVLQWVAFALAFELLARERVERQDLVAVAAGALATVGLLGKVDIGVFLTVGAAVVVGAISERRARGLALYGGTLVLVGLGLWLVTGQGLTDLVGYARGSYEIISGYSDAMGVTHPEGRWLAIAYVLVAALIAVLAFLTSRDWPRVRRVALALILSVLLFALWKQGFVRDHFAATFAGLGLTVLVVMPRSLPRPAIAGLVVMTLVGAVVGSQVLTSSYFDARVSAVRFAHQVRVVLQPWRWEAATEQTRHRLQRIFDVPADVVAANSGGTVSIDPYDAGVPTAYPELVWGPLPVFQAYSAYTPYLDQLNAARLRAPDRPQRILRPLQRSPDDPQRIYAVDRRFYWFESPAATLERLCRYREVMASGTWQVLQDTGQACGTPVTLGTVTAAQGEPVPVPAAPGPDDLVIVRVHGLGGGVVDRLRAVLWKGPEWEVVVNGTPYRLVPGTAADGLVLSVPAAAQGSPPFAFGDPIRTIAVRERGSRGGGELSYEFSAVPLPAP